MRLYSTIPPITDCGSPITSYFPLLTFHQPRLSPTTYPLQKILHLRPVCPHQMCANKKRCSVGVVTSSYKNLSRRKLRHVAIDAVFLQHETRYLFLRAEVGSTRSVTTHATCRKQSQVARLPRMNVVACRAIHVAHPKARAQGKEPQLVAVDIERRSTIRFVHWRGKIVKPIANHKSKRRHKIVAHTRMT